MKDLRNADRIGVVWCGSQGDASKSVSCLKEGTLIAMEWKDCLVSKARIFRSQDVSTLRICAIEARCCP